MVLKSFEILDSSTGHSLLAHGQYVQAETAEDARQHFFEEMNGQYSKDYIEVKEVSETPRHPPNLKLRPPRTRVCPNCSYKDPTGADTCPNCGPSREEDKQQAA
ncbi:MAG TPA: zinc ribbon domain-containing protein [Candidatus Magasanikbacteria bacterium]|nr:zinc ribbon domain-containing protein [Candidatus Magasanikbacteria bacterium]